MTPADFDPFDGDTVFADNVQIVIDEGMTDKGWNPTHDGGTIRGMVVLDDDYGIVLHDDPWEDGARPVRAFVLTGDGSLANVVVISESEPTFGNGKGGEVLRVTLDAPVVPDELSAAMANEIEDGKKKIRTAGLEGVETTSFYQAICWDVEAGAEGPGHHLAVVK